MRFRVTDELTIAMIRESCLVNDQASVRLTMSTNLPASSLLWATKDEWFRVHGANSRHLNNQAKTTQTSSNRPKYAAYFRTLLAVVKAPVVNSKQLALIAGWEGGVFSPKGPMADLSRGPQTADGPAS